MSGRKEEDFGYYADEVGVMDILRGLIIVSPRGSKINLEITTPQGEVITFKAERVERERLWKVESNALDEEEEVTN